MSGRHQTWEDAVVWLRAQPDQVELVEACFFDDPLLGAAQRYYASTEWQAARQFVGRSPGRALDIGAGRGISSYALARDGWQVTAVEPDPSEVVGAGAIRGLARASDLPIEVVTEWGESLPFPDASFDLVYGREVLHHARDLEAFCAEMARVLKPGGTFLATREHVIYRDADLAVFLARHPLHWLYGGEHAYRLRDYRRAIEGSGIQLTRLLKPWASAINLYPHTMLEISRSVRARLPFVPGALITPALLRLVGSFRCTPGAAYSFVGIRVG